jgi:hypothetical protein
MNELDFLRLLEQDINYLQRRCREGYSGLPEIAAIKGKLNQRIIQVLATAQGEGEREAEKVER